MIDTNIYKLASYLYYKDNFKQALSILNRHILTMSKKNQAAKEILSLRDECARKLATLEQNKCIPAEPPSSIKRAY